VTGAEVEAGVRFGLEGGEGAVQNFEGLGGISAVSEDDGSLEEGTGGPLSLSDRLVARYGSIQQVDRFVELVLVSS
jgi:hypothetical protein